MLTSLVICLFARGVYTEDVVLKALAVAGFNWSTDELTRLGAQTLRCKNNFKAREGFDLAQVLQERGPRFGLQTMRERAEEIGGTFQVDTTPGHGTRVRVQLSRR